MTDLLLMGMLLLACASTLYVNVRLLQLARLVEDVQRGQNEIVRVWQRDHN